MSWKENVGVCAGIVVAAGIMGVMADYFTSNKIPNANRVEQGYVIPSKLEIELQDQNRIGRDEVILKYEEKSYLFMVDKQGKPVIKEYEVKPAEVLPK